MMNKKKESLLISILFPLAVGFVSWLLSNGTQVTYRALKKPALSPPSIIFPIVWTILYILMGISAYLISSSQHTQKQEAMRIYFIQLVFNFFWSIFFFHFGWLLFSLAWLIVLILLIIKMIQGFRQINAFASYLQIPYLLWCTFAAYLNFGVYILNRSQQ